MGGHLSHLKPKPLLNVLNSTCGPVQGNLYRHGNEEVHGYLGIPYAQPPIGILRFKKPVSADVWTETRDCTKYGPRCPPSGMLYENLQLPNTDIPDEANCLSLNVFCPQWEIKQSAKHPVMIFIHGGGFELSASKDYCDYSLSGTLPLKDVIVVTVNYRVGALGFLTTGDDSCRGNFGLWDLTLALKWVSTHISSFGGDPKNVTLFGQSAGAVCADLLNLSPYSRDLFHKLIIMSGSAHVPFAIRTEENQALVCMEYARSRGFSGSGSAELLEFFENLPIEKLLEKTGLKHTVSIDLSFAPNLDGDFFPKPLEELRRETRKKPVIVGMMEDEGLITAFADGDFTTCEENFKRRVESEYRGDVVENPENVQKNIMNFYTNYCDESEERKLVDYIGHSVYNAGVLLSAESLARAGNCVYFYVFDFWNPDGFGPVGSIVPFKGAAHCSELRYIIGEGVYSKFDANEKDLKMMEYMTTMFTNFAKYGNPNIPGVTNWETYTEGSRHFHIDSTDSEMKDSFQENRCQFLKQIQEQSKRYQHIFYGKK
ncbi:Carboxylic ester hydrolase [Caenorhabditis elegans]|uniref:Carboxylic ester hydrolase n=1 Tax=Caenorhabditis elegans TaxID=6239 RepID=Q23009_CAEEL|nr:Carboxylic ester hydrolase [Caenorhabditis elegans]CCD72925.2 Carboxylic ester hydrolase [Caenorhabditis elegans]|eukprot:NP_504692.3 Carboxylic ester hydrolase [Caenorhabditis elegans]